MCASVLTNLNESSVYIKAKKDATSELFTIKEASDWASKYLNKKVTTSNISYLIQYGRIKKIGSNGDTFIVKEDLIKYYDSYLGKRETEWKGQLGFSCPKGARNMF